MKTPRELLEHRHQATEPKLDRIREGVVAKLKQQTATREHNLPTTVALKLWQELVLPCRRIWGGLTTVWVAIMLFNLSQAEPNRQTSDLSAAQGAEMRVVFQEQQRVLAELVGPVRLTQPVAPPRRDEPHPRSEAQSAVMTA